MASSLEIAGINKRFGNGDKSVEVLRRVDIHVAPGEFLILVGPSGCGKSTLLNIIAGLDDPTEGEVRIGGKNVVGMPPRDRDIAMVFQSYALYPTMSVADNIGFALEMRKMPKAERQKRIDEVAAMLQISHLLDRRPSQLSGGQRQRVAMGRALARQPQLFLFDEPLSNLDAKLRVEMRAEIKLLHQRTRTTTVYVTHDQVEAMTLGDRIAVMRAGEVQQFGTPQQIYERPANKFVAEFVGSPAMNFFAAADRPGQEFGVRPEHLLLGAPGDGLPGRVLMLEPTGPETYVKLETPLGTMTARVAGRASQQAGDKVGLSWAAEHAHRFDGDSGRRLEAA